ncbi:uncharacterized protein AC631_02116 [Debaryomyces fabryi]|uniref:DUF676 domain-containing protein n=1 Tax=Debaryomyces fabryi TaxID=58627 RepID=A0A0V1Q0R3_9ASCO|nr:uncharacterized protein AC631_02116 [Debaryomyces fabryi]KSA02120.1 hypothetical protein AC631_02116 [Debaryomyces fabryi]
MDYLESQIQQIKPPNGEKIITYKTNSHGGFLTYDGIDVNGKRIANEITAETDKLDNTGHKVRKFSILGYSLGGLISRYAIGVLYYEGYFEKAEPVNFITFCSPHVGAIKPYNSFLSKMFNGFASYFLAHSGAQLFLKDKQQVKSDYAGNNNHNLPLLVWMAEPASTFYVALSKFKHRSVYANAIGDKRAGFFTAAIATMDPFQSMVDRNASAYDFDYVEGYEPTVIDFTKPISFSKLEETKSAHARSTVSKIVPWLKLLVSVILFTPLWFFWFFYKTISERIKLNKRVSLFFNETSLLHLYSYPDHIFDDSTSEDETPHPANEKYKLEQNSKHEPHESLFYSLEKELGEQVRDQTDIFVDSIFDAANSQGYEEYEYSISSRTRKRKSRDTPSQKSDADFSSTIKEMENYEVPSDPSLSQSKLVALNGKNIDSFRLNLSSNELYIIHKLNMLEWEKVPVIIRNTKLTHSAAIVRQDEPAFEEGKTIVRHFVEQNFKSA